VTRQPLQHVAKITPRLDAQPLAGVLDETVRRMGDVVAVRLGLSRPFFARQESGPGYCWLMADAFFSLANPQP
jgi:hypothetical protein